MKEQTQELLTMYREIAKRFEANNDGTIPFCAAEPIVSDFTKMPLQSAFSDRYLKSGVRAFDHGKDFVGTEYLFPLYELISEACGVLFGAVYADARPLSGMNAALAVLMSLTSIGDRVLLLNPDAGGHESFIALCDRLGLAHDPVPFDVVNIQYDIAALKNIVSERAYAAIIFPPSDLISPPPIEDLTVPETTRIIYDCTQSFGLIATGHHPNPLQTRHDVVLLGGTHKTLPGPVCGLVMANRELTANLLENSITPSFVRNPQPHHVASLALTLIEFIEHGQRYMDQVVSNANALAEALRQRGFDVKSLGEGASQPFTVTHQVFVSVRPEEAKELHRTCRRLNITLDQRDKRMYGPAGIRLGVQAVTRLGWGENELGAFADFLLAVRDRRPHDELKRRADAMRGKEACLYAIDVSGHESPAF